MAAPRDSASERASGRAAARSEVSEGLTIGKVEVVDLADGQVTVEYPLLFDPEELAEAS